MKCGHACSRLCSECLSVETHGDCTVPIPLKCPCNYLTRFLPCRQIQASIVLLNAPNPTEGEPKSSNTLTDKDVMSSCVEGASEFLAEEISLAGAESTVEEISLADAESTVQKTFADNGDHHRSNVDVVETRNVVKVDAEGPLVPCDGSCRAAKFASAFNMPPSSLLSPILNQQLLRHHQTNPQLLRDLHAQLSRFLLSNERSVELQVTQNGMNIATHLVNACFVNLELKQKRVWRVGEAFPVVDFTPIRLCFILTSHRSLCSSCTIHFSSV